MEIQITDFENTAYAIFIVLLTRAILSFGLNFYIPISKVDENMKKAHKRGAVLNEKFYFRKNVFTKQRKLSNTLDSNLLCIADQLPIIFYLWVQSQRRDNPHQAHPRLHHQERMTATES